MDLPVEAEVDVVRHQHVAAIRRERGVFDLHRIDGVFAAHPRQRGGHGGRAILAHFRGRESGPARLAIARLVDQHDARAKVEDGLQLLVVRFR